MLFQITRNRCIFAQWNHADERRTVTVRGNFLFVVLLWGNSWQSWIFRNSVSITAMCHAVSAAILSTSPSIWQRQYCSCAWVRQPEKKQNMPATVCRITKWRLGLEQCQRGRKAPDIYVCRIIGLTGDDVTLHSNMWQQDGAPYKSMLQDKSLTGWSSLFLRRVVWKILTTLSHLSVSYFNRNQGLDKCAAVFRSCRSWSTVSRHALLWDTIFI